jgi:ketol-acid reductoisomerase
MKFYHDTDVDIGNIKDETIGIVGYGCEGSAWCTNAINSGLPVVIGNREDEYAVKARRDGHQVLSIEDAVGRASIIPLLVSDEAQGELYRAIEGRLEEGDAIVTAHGFSLLFDEMKPRTDLDVIMLAPRMPGDPIRDAYSNGEGVPAFFSVFQDYTGRAKERGLALAKAIGFTRAGVGELSVRQETVIDLFMEQYYVAGIIQQIQDSFNVLTEAGFSPEAVVSELYVSGDFGRGLLKAAEDGLFEAFRGYVSQDSQFGTAQTRAFDAWRQGIQSEGNRDPRLFGDVGYTRARVDSLDHGIQEYVEGTHLSGIMQLMQNSFEVLTEAGYSPEAVVSELYASGEIGEVLLKAADQGLFAAFQNNASLTCQFGIAQARVRTILGVGKGPKEILNDIEDGSFARSLEGEAAVGFSMLSGYNAVNARSPITEAWRNVKDGSVE